MLLRLLMKLLKIKLTARNEKKNCFLDLDTKAVAHILNTSNFPKILTKKYRCRYYATQGYQLSLIVLVIV